mmetsp:Transcript_47081/g.86316  ORF Transcript_47081/g.86316 Transcript_47081/m.86316 type:complete len:342 (+) Transcript_47081:126-1151(+)
MIPLLLGIVEFPYTLLVTAGGMAILCGCVWCSRWRLRDWSCCKCLLRFVRYDNFDDFELRVMVHDVSYGKLKQKTYLKITAGRQKVETDPSSSGKFHEKMDILVEQGATVVKFDLMDTRHHVLAQLKLNTVRDILEAKGLCEERTYNMNPKHKSIGQPPKLTLTMLMNFEGDEETPLIADGSSDMNILLLQHISKTAREHHENHGNALVTEIETLREAGSGSAELFRGTSKTEHVYLAIVGPPMSRRWTLGLWPDIKDFQSRKPSLVDVDMLKIQSVQPDAVRKKVFTVHYFDDLRIAQKLTIRTIEINRDVWVEMLTRLITIAHDQRREMKEMRTKPGRI